MARVVVVGSVNMDLLFDVAVLPGPGATVLASALHHPPGGKGGNQAVAAVGDDPAGRALLDHLIANGVDVGAVVTLPVPTGTAAVMVGRSAENMIVVAPGADTLCGSSTGSDSGAPSEAAASAALSAAFSEAFSATRSASAELSSAWSASPVPAVRSPAVP